MSVGRLVAPFLGVTFVTAVIWLVLDQPVFEPITLILGGITLLLAVAQMLATRRLLSLALIVIGFPMSMVGLLALLPQLPGSAVVKPWLLRVPYYVSGLSLAVELNDAALVTAIQSNLDTLPAE